MTTAKQKTIEEQGAASATDASVADVLTAWDGVFQGVKAQVRSHATLVASDLHLSIKAIVVTLISIFILVGLGLVLWVTLLMGLTYGLTSLGCHWLWSVLLVVALNVSALLMTRGILRSAMASVKMTASAESLFKTDCDPD